MPGQKKTLQHHIRQLYTRHINGGL